MKRTSRSRSILLWVFAAGIAINFAIPGVFGGAALAGKNKTDSSVYELFFKLAQTSSQRSKQLLAAESAGAENGLDLAVLTNAGYAAIEGRNTAACIDGLAQGADVSIGAKSLVPVHSSEQTPLWFFFVDLNTGNAVYCQPDPGAISFSDFTFSKDPYSKLVMKNVDTENLLADPSAANEEIFKTKAFNGNEFRMIGLSCLLLKDAPFSLINAAKYHDHYCPGVTSGYFLVEYLKTRFPLTDSYSRYSILSMPVYCKDDALITLLNVTPGKRGYCGFQLSAADKKHLRPDAKHLAGVFFRWNGDQANPEGEGVILSFDFSEAKQNCGWGKDNPWNWWTSRLRMNLFYLEHIKEPARFVSEIPFKGGQRFELNQIQEVNKPTDLMRPGVNPLEIFGLLQTGG